MPFWKNMLKNSKIDEEIKKYFPEAQIEIIPEVLNGAVLTCIEGIKNIDNNYPQSLMIVIICFIVHLFIIIVMMINYLM